MMVEKTAILCKSGLIDPRYLSLPKSIHHEYPLHLSATILDQDEGQKGRKSVT